MTMLEGDKQERKDERDKTLGERVPVLQMSGLSLQDLQVRVALSKCELPNKVKTFRK